MRERLHDFLNMCRESYLFSTVLSSSISMLMGVAFTIYNGVLGVAYHLSWNGSICVYYFLLSGIRAILVYTQRNHILHHDEHGLIHQKRIYCYTHVMLLLINIALIVSIAVMVKGEKSYTHGLIPAIIMATYTTYRITMSIIHFRRARKSQNLFVLELRTLNLIDSLVAILTLQNTLILANGGMSAGMQRLSAWTSAGILSLILVISIRSFLKLKVWNLFWNDRYKQR